jgi:hypothetical protein
LSGLCQHPVNIGSEESELTHDLGAKGHDVASHLVGWCMFLMRVGKLKTLVAKKDKGERERRKTKKKSMKKACEN